MKQFLKFINSWENYILLGILMLFVSVGWYAMYYENDAATMKLSMAIVGVVGAVFMIGSFVSWKKKQRIIKKNNEQDNTN